VCPLCQNIHNNTVCPYNLNKFVQDIDYLVKKYVVKHPKNLIKKIEELQYKYVEEQLKTSYTDLSIEPVVNFTTEKQYDISQTNKALQEIINNDNAKIKQLKEEIKQIDDKAHELKLNLMYAEKDYLPEFKKKLEERTTWWQRCRMGNTKAEWKTELKAYEMKINKLNKTVENVTQHININNSIISRKGCGTVHIQESDKVYWQLSTITTQCKQYLKQIKKCEKQKDQYDAYMLNLEKYEEVARSMQDLIEQKKELKADIKELKYNKKNIIIEYKNIAYDKLQDKYDAFNAKKDNFYFKVAKFNEKKEQIYQEAEKRREETMSRKIANMRTIIAGREQDPKKAEEMLERWKKAYFKPKPTSHKDECSDDYASYDENSYDDEFVPSYD
jgi:chromosome segregation ATPase